jgi:hypothetical protein
MVKDLDYGLGELLVWVAVERVGVVGEKSFNGDDQVLWGREWMYGR